METTVMVPSREQDALAFAPGIENRLGKDKRAQDERGVGLRHTLTLAAG